MELKRKESAIVDPRSSIFHSRSAFTLIELMISIALVLLLILGVNQIFTYTTQAVGAGEAVNSAIRYSRTLQSELDSDFAAMVSPGGGPNDSASLIICSYANFAFHDKTDQASDLDGFANTRDLNNNHIEGESTVPGEIVQPWTYNLRNHRFDTLSFFARDLFSRQTGNLGTYADNMSSQEAWVWYGHLWLPDNNGNWTTSTLPGQGSLSTNPNNLFAVQFVLGRVAVLLREKSVDSNNGLIADNAGFYQRFIDRQQPYPTGTTLATDLQPLCANAPAAVGSTGDSSSWLLQDSRFDLAATSIQSFRNKLQSYISNTQVAASRTAWWDQMMDGNPNPTIPLPQPGNYVVSNRFRCNPYAPKPLDSNGMAQASPYCLGGCGQFIVEYAGDYLTQQNNPSAIGYGGIQKVAPDGQIDYVLINPNTPQQRKQIIWYGLPRNTSGNASINRFNGDVMPLAVWTNNVPQSFEKTGPQMNFDSAGNLLTMQPGAPYVCAWGPGDVKPKLIRITVTVDDPTGRLPEGQTYQFIYAVP
jgi:prepilin-type N-terminal cleavage/methylation domain-containing protein